MACSSTPLRKTFGKFQIFCTPLTCMNMHATIYSTLLLVTRSFLKKFITLLNWSFGKIKFTTCYITHIFLACLYVLVIVMSTTVELPQISSPSAVTVTAEFEQEVPPPTSPEPPEAPPMFRFPHRARRPISVLTTIIVALLLLALCWLVCRPFSNY